ncbi:MAG: hypothetical protein AABY22_34140 [Nanoarchaeota archaeon]
MKKQVLGISLGALITAAITVSAFYFNTNSTLKVHSEDIGIIKTDIKSLDEKVSNINIEPIKLEEKVKNLQEQIRNMEGKIDKNNTNVNERTDKIFELLVTIKNGKK